ncbi:MAG: DUF1624 domain-containing protein [Oscillospiraceae bacterium]|nr:DUF1624 domain-containing protein [Oscillospiraceae bacterium]
MKQDKSNRIEIIDALRGLSVVLMVAYHLLYNLTAFLGAPQWFFSNPVFDILQPFFAGLFIFLSGISSRFSHSNVKRGLLALMIAAVITLVTSIIDMPIWWGVLHLLAFSMVFFGLTQKLWDMVPKTATPIIFLALLIAGAIAVGHIQVICEHPWLRYPVSMLGWRQAGFVSFDYFPIVPWLFVFLLGTWAGIYIRDRRLPGWFYEYNVPIFPKVGRKALIVYILHQPVLYGAVIGIRHLFF